MGNVLTEVEELENAIAKLQIELKGRQDRLEYIRRNCTHAWNETVFEPIHTPGSYTPGDKPTMGSDWGGPVEITPKTTRQWRRVCNVCKLNQITQRTKKMPVAGIVPGTTGEAEIPDFS